MLYILKKFYFPIALFIAAFPCLGTDCNIHDVKYVYHFSERIDLYPAKENYKTGDTIWLALTKPDKLLWEVSKNRKVLVDTCSITFQFGMETPDFNSRNYPPGGLYDYIISSGGGSNKYLNQNEGLLETFGCNATNTYDFKIGIILKQKGVFAISFEVAQRPVLACSNRVNPFPLSDINYSFNLADCNEALFQSLPHNIKGYFSEDGINQQTDYLFKVE